MIKKLKWITIQKKINDLVPLQINPRKITDEKKDKLKKSLEKFDLADIPVINLDGIVISGNKRMEVLQAMGRGDETIDVRQPNRQLTEKELKEYSLIANTHAGEFDLDLLDEFYNDIDIEEIGFNIEGWDKVDNSIDLNKFFDQQVEPGNEKHHNITLEYSEKDFTSLMEKFKSIGGTKEKIIYDLLINQE